MKYKDNGQWKEIYIKALDSMPVGTEVDFDGQASDIPVGWEQVDDPSVYSNTERVVGTWFGKPLYRKDYNTYTPSGNNMLLDTMANIDIVKFEGSVKFKYDTVDVYYWRDINVADASTGTLRSTYSAESNNIVIARSSFDGRYLLNGVHVSVYYTKTTD